MHKMDTKLIKTHNELVSEYYKKCTSYIFNMFSNIVYPIYGADNQGNPIHIGSCFIVEYNFNKFLITASHVINEKNKAKTNLYIGIKGENGGLIDIIGNLILLNSKIDKSDKIDIAVIKLAKTRYNTDIWNRLTYLPFRYLEHQKDDVTKKIGVAIGYPNSKNKISRHNLKMTGLSHSSLLIHEEDIFISVGANSENHILVEYDETVKDEKDIIYNAPKPTGMSGGALVTFNLAVNNYLQDTLPDIKVSGVLIEYHKIKKVLLATKIKYVLKAIEELEKQASGLD
ncbi:hypothetical protein MIS45_03740 [Wielerella bovis]|uniref:hypothetical protein n=1 Tax=Wielerella bovis TaxID=2917790 RepID=UPI0020186B93|nr:hypothetical protein [Wielerella bovis]ULJ69957.1 hypothetical protein MIS45_03740 [Wielerella bovis]